MSNAAIAWAKKQKTGSPTLKAVLVAIADYADEEGRCWPSQKRISDDTELAERTVRKALSDLEDLKFIQRFPRQDFNRQTYLTDIIKLLPSRSADGETQRQLVPGPAASGANPAAFGAEPAAAGAKASGTSRQKPAAPHAAKPLYEPSQEPSERTGGPRSDAEASRSGDAAPPKPNREDRATRIPDDWHLGDVELSTALALGLNEAQARFQADKFKDYWQSKGKNATKTNWYLTWRNWCREESQKLPSTAQKLGVNRFGDPVNTGGSRYAL